MDGRELLPLQSVQESEFLLRFILSRIETFLKEFLRHDCVRILTALRILPSLLVLRCLFLGLTEQVDHLVEPVG